MSWITAVQCEAWVQLLLEC